MVNQRSRSRIMIRQKVPSYENRMLKNESPVLLSNALLFPSVACNSCHFCSDSSTKQLSACLKDLAVLRIGTSRLSKFAIVGAIDRVAHKDGRQEKASIFRFVSSLSPPLATTTCTTRWWTIRQIRQINNVVRKCSRHVPVPLGS